MLFNHLRTALRNVWKQRATNAINITGLAAGMTSAVLIFLWVTNELTFDNYHPASGRIHRVTSYIGTAKWTWETAPYPLVAATRTSLPQVEAVTFLEPWSLANVNVGNEFFPEKNAAYVDSAWFSIFHYDFVAGNPRSFFSSRYNLILTRTKAKKYFGEADPIGRTLRIDTTDYKIAGVIKDVPANSSFQFDLIMPIDALLSDPDRLRYTNDWGNFNGEVYMRLRPGARPEAINAAITNLYIANNNAVRNHSHGTKLSLIPLKDIHFETGLTNSSGAIIHANRSTVTIFSILGIFLLVIACINYVNLTTARASIRAKEVGIRKIIGAGKNSLFLQFITESLVISTLALLMTLAAVTLLLPAFRNLTDKQFPSPFTNSQTWSIIAITLLAATALNGVYPALLLSSFRPLNVLRGVTIMKFKDVFLRKSLVVLQFTFSIILIVGTLIIQRQLNYVQHTDPGYNRSQTLAVNMYFIRQRSKNDRQAFTESIKQELLAHTGITGVTVANGSIVNIQSSSSGNLDWDGRDTSFRPTVYQLSADEDYKKVLQLQMAQGHWFDAASPQDKHNFILNETAVKSFNLTTPVLGHTFRFHNDTGTLIGIVKDFHFASLHDRIQPLVISNDDRSRATVFIRTEPGKATQALAVAHDIVKRYTPSRPFDYTFLDDQFDALYKADQKVSTLITLFSGIAVLISCLGLFALAAFTAQQRIKEIGIRKVLGATVPNIVTLLSRDFVRLVGISIGIATPIAAWAMHNWLNNFAYHIPLSVWFFITGGALALLIAILTVSTQSLKAATSNPVKNLRVD
jgi:putative ABC transport system permease protein